MPSTTSASPPAPSTTQTPSSHLNSHSQRSTRGSRPSTRRSTPAASNDASSSSSGFTPINSGSSEWTEPPVVNKPSYREYDDRALMNGSTLQMLPLGEMPSQKVMDAARKSSGMNGWGVNKGRGRGRGGNRGRGSGRGGKGGVNASATGQGMSSESASARTSVSPDVASAPETMNMAPQMNPAAQAPVAAMVDQETEVEKAKLLAQQQQIQQVELASLAPAPAQAQVQAPAPIAAATPSKPPMTPGFHATPAPQEINPHNTPTPNTPSVGMPNTQPIQRPNRPPMVERAMQTDRVLDPKDKKLSGTPGSKNPPANVWLNGNTPCSKTPQGRQRLTMVVEAAITRAESTGNSSLAQAVKKLYRESLTDEGLADLLDAVLAQKATEAQIKQFQGYVRTAREHPIALSEALKTNEPFFSKMAVEARERKAREAAESTVAATAGAELVAMRVNDSNGDPSSTPTPKPAPQLQQQRNMAPVHYTPTPVARIGKTTASRPIFVDELRASPDDVEMADHSPSSSTAPSIAGTTTRASSSAPHFQPEELAPYEPHNGPIPAIEDIRQDSHIRGPPPRPTRVQTRKRPRSPSISIPAEDKMTGGAGGNTPTTTTTTVAPSPGGLGFPPIPTLPPVSAQQTYTPQPPKKKSKTAKTKSAKDTKKETPYTAFYENVSVTAGVTRNTREGSEEVSENEDSCAVCSGFGHLVCCERCPKSFHLTCVNPPLSADPPGIWFCHRCSSQMHPPPHAPRGLFSPLLDRLNRQNPSSFTLPSSIRSFYLGVETGPHGEYVDSKDARHSTGKGGKKDQLQVYDQDKLRDRNGALVLCHECGKSAMEGVMVGCDHCPLSWHLDCVRPVPLAAVPNGVRKWMCPAHTGGLVGGGRVPRRARVVDTCLRRGHRNNGNIEIELEEEEELESMQFDEVTAGGVIHRLPERGIKLDFLTEAKRQNELLLAAARRRPQPSVPSSPPAPTPAPSTTTTEVALSKFDASHLEAAATLANLFHNQPIPALALVPSLKRKRIDEIFENLLMDAPEEAKSVLESLDQPLDGEKEEWDELVQLKALQDAVAKRIIALTPAALAPIVAPAVPVLQVTGNGNPAPAPVAPMAAMMGAPAPASAPETPMVGDGCDKTQHQHAHHHHDKPNEGEKEKEKVGGEEQGGEEKNEKVMGDAEVGRESGDEADMEEVRGVESPNFEIDQDLDIDMEFGEMDGRREEGDGGEEGGGIVSRSEA